jgi:hypothetical protein
MGQQLGKTPLTITRRQVFPIRYPEGMQGEYGKVTLHYPGCAPYTTGINNTMLKEGLDAKLQCTPAEKPVPARPAQGHAAPPVPGNTRARLLELQQLYEEGLVTEQEYQEKRRAILDGL